MRWKLRNGKLENITKVFQLPPLQMIMLVCKQLEQEFNLNVLIVTFPHNRAHQQAQPFKFILVILRRSPLHEVFLPQRGIFYLRKHLRVNRINVLRWLRFDLEIVKVLNRFQIFVGQLGVLL